MNFRPVFRPTHLLVVLVAVLAQPAPVHASPRDREIETVTAPANPQAVVELAEDVPVRLERAAKRFLITVHAGRYRAYASDKGGTYFLHEGSGLLIPGNFGKEKPGGIFVPNDDTAPLGLWIKPHHGGENAVQFLGLVHADQAAAFRRLLKKIAPFYPPRAAARARLNTLRGSGQVSRRP